MKRIAAIGAAVFLTSSFAGEPHKSDKASTTQIVNELIDCSAFYEFTARISEQADPSKKATATYLRDMHAATIAHGVQCVIASAQVPSMR